MRRIRQFIHVAKITGASKLRISNLGRPNIEMEIPAPEALDLPDSATALYVTISAKVFGKAVAHEGRDILRNCMKREYALIILDMRLAQTADSHGIRWLAQLMQTAHWYNISLRTRVSPAVALVLELAGLDPKVLERG